MLFFEPLYGTELEALGKRHPPLTTVPPFLFKRAHIEMSAAHQG